MADPPAAAEAWQRAIRIYDDLGDPAADVVRQLLARVAPGHSGPVTPAG